jgi:dinuclear metal center YbgI/SA1388 family protein
MPSAHEIASYLDEVLNTEAVPDYSLALNGLQLTKRAPVDRLAAAVDVSVRVIREAVARDAGLLIVHHGLFWGGPQRLIGPPYDRLGLLFDHDIAVYSSHLPLDAHATLGNNPLLARELALVPDGPFARHEGFPVGVSGQADVATHDLFARADAHARRFGGVARMTHCPPDRRTLRWGLCSGAGASTTTLNEAMSLGLDTLIVGEGPHHTAVQADESGLVVIYAGHYATETLGVAALARSASEAFGIPWSFIDVPTGL